MRIIIILFLCSIVNSLYSQVSSGLAIQFVPQFEGKVLDLDEKIYHPEMDSILFETFRFYISQIEFFDKENLVYREENSFHLLDASDSSSLKLLLNLPKSLSFSTLSFNLGIDSTTNSSGAQGGDLDPSKGMYWTWQSGYINFKLEGISTSCPARNNRFQFHIGGYSAPFNTLQKIKIPIDQTKKIKINIEIANFLKNLNLEEQYQIMSPNQKAIEAAQQFSSMFTVSD